MKAITIYVADDGSEHDSKSSAEKRDTLHRKVAKAMYPLHVPVGDSISIEAGKGWYQHNAATVVACRDAILDLCCAEGLAKDFPVFKHRGVSVHPLSIIGRILGDMDGPLDDAWRRFCCIDQNGREFDQAYFAYYAEKDGAQNKKHVCIGKASDV